MDIVRHPSEAEQVLRMLPGQLRGLRKLPPEAGAPASARLLTSHVRGLQETDACLEAHPDTDCCGAMLKLWTVQESGAAELQLVSLGCRPAAGQHPGGCQGGAGAHGSRAEGVPEGTRASAGAAHGALRSRRAQDEHAAHSGVFLLLGNSMVRACILGVSCSSVACLLCLGPTISVEVAEHHLRDDT